MDIFEQGYADTMEKEQPLAARMRPRTLEEFAGQDHIVGRGRLLYRAIKADQLSSIIFYGPPGTGKTSLAIVIAHSTKCHFVTVNAVLAGVKEIRHIVEEARERRKYHQVRTILFVDEVHRWNKAQQDALLPWVENGTIILIGATIENPYFEVNRALVSRSRIFQLKSLTQEDLLSIARKAISDPIRGYGRYCITIDDDALAHLANVANGDARSLLNALELAVETTPEHFPPQNDGERIHIDLWAAEESIQQKVVLYDKEGDYHFDTISAFIKSLRGSDPDAALYWLAKMIYAGEDPHFILRRMLIFASEDIGMADPNALIFTEAAAAAFDRVGLPEGRFHLANAVLYLATAPKSNSVLAFFDALKTVEHESESEPPDHLKDGSRDQNGFGHGKGYLYPHAFRDHWVAQQYLPDSLQGRIFYNPVNIGYEAAIKSEVERKRETQLSVMFELAGDSADILTFSPPDREKERWLNRVSGSLTRHLSEVRDTFFRNLNISRHWLALDLNPGQGLLMWELLRRVPEGGVWALVDAKNTVLKHLVQELPELDRPHIIEGDASHIADVLEIIGGNEQRFDLIIGRNVLLHRKDKKELLKTVYNLLREDGFIALVEPLSMEGQRLSGLLNTSMIESGLLNRLKSVEEAILGNAENPKVNWNRDAIERMVREAGYNIFEFRKESYVLERTITSKDLERWLNTGTEPADLKPEGMKTMNYANAIRSGFEKQEINELLRVFRENFEGKTVNWNKKLLFLTARKSKRAQ